MISWLAAVAAGPKAPDESPLMAQNSSRCSQTVSDPNRDIGPAGNSQCAAAHAPLRCARHGP